MHLCNTLGQVFFAVCDILRTNNLRAVIVYLGDEVRLDPQLTTRFSVIFPQIQLIELLDKKAAEEFANLPKWVPDIIRRNARFSKSSIMQRTRSWRHEKLPETAIRNSYVYNSGFFMSKVVAGMTEHVILRECGLNNYVTHRVSPAKGLLRLMFGLSPIRQTFGEERWINAIEVSAPESLPKNIQRKARRLDFNALSSELNAQQVGNVVNLFRPDFPALPKDKKSALVLTQPIEDIGFCNLTTKIELYDRLSTYLREAGFEVFLRNHPREVPFDLPHTTRLRSGTPIEIWPMTTKQKFDFGISLCSASLAYSNASFCKKAIQLVAMEEFSPSKFKTWQGDILANLIDGLAE